jgi:DNA polymerase
MSADLFDPPSRQPKSLAELNRMIASASDLGKGDAVPGEGPLHAVVAFVGEQPGDQEDREGRPFVGPAGLLLNKAMDEAGIDRAKTYVTNAVKRFRFVQRGKRRIHSRPTAAEVRHERWWLEKELDFVDPKVTVALGATAVLALAGKPLLVGANRGPATFEGRPGYITVHPSYLLRMPDPDARSRAYADFVKDLRKVRDIARLSHRGQRRRVAPE